MMPFPLICLVAPFGLYFLPYKWVLAGTGAFTIAAAMPVMFSKNSGDAQQKLFIFAAAFFAALAINHHHPMLAYSALSLWGIRQIFKLRGLPMELRRVRLAVTWFAAFAPLALTILFGEIGFFKAVLAALAMTAVAGIIADRIARNSRGMTVEASAAAFLAVLFTFRLENLAFLNSPLLGVVYGALCGVLIFRFGLLERLAAWVLAFCGTVIFIAGGRELFLFYLFFFAVFEMGKRLPYRRSEGATSSHWIQRAFIAASLGGGFLAFLSAGASDPFPFYFAIAGTFSAAVFSAWVGWEEYTLRRLLLGFWGSALLAACGWVSSTYPAGAAPLVMAVGFAAVGAHYARGVLASPEKDQVWLEYAFGALSGMFLFKEFVGYLN